MLYSIDRIEDGTATLVDEAGTSLALTAGLLPPGAREGDMLRCENGVYTLDPELTRQRRAQSQALLDRLLGKNGG